MKIKELEIHEAIEAVCTARTIEESVHIFSYYQSLLHDCRFIFAANDGPTPGFPVNHNFSKTGAIHSLFKTGKILFLDRKILKDMGKGDATFSVDYSISLDSQAVRYLKSYIQGTLSRLPEDFKEAFKFIAHPEINFDPMPYLYENLLKPNSEPNRNEIFLYYKCYELLKTLDYDYFLTCGKIRSTESDEQLNIQTQKSLAEILYHFDKSSKEELESQINIHYCLILKMAIIHFHRPKLTSDQKIHNFLEFTDQELATIFIRETIVACEFFKEGNNLGFFRKIQQNNLEVLETIRNMAWDFWHIRHLERLATNPFNEACYFFPSLLTFDRDLVKIINLCPLKAIAYIGSIRKSLPFYESEVIKNTIGPLNIEYYLSEETKKSQNNRQGNIKGNLKNLINELESEVKEYINF